MDENLKCSLQKVIGNLLDKCEIVKEVCRHTEDDVDVPIPQTDEDQEVEAHTEEVEDDITVDHIRNLDHDLDLAIEKEAHGVHLAGLIQEVEVGKNLKQHVSPPCIVFILMLLADCMLSTTTLPDGLIAKRFFNKIYLIFSLYSPSRHCMVMIFLLSQFLEFWLPSQYFSCPIFSQPMQNLSHFPWLPFLTNH